MEESTRDIDPPSKYTPSTMFSPSDVILVVEGFKLHVHKQLLTDNSPVFKRMVESDFNLKIAIIGYIYITYWCTFTIIKFLLVFMIYLILVLVWKSWIKINNAFGSICHRKKSLYIGETRLVFEVNVTLFRIIFIHYTSDKKLYKNPQIFRALTISSEPLMLFIGTLYEMKCSRCGL